MKYYLITTYLEEGSPLITIHRYPSIRQKIEGPWKMVFYCTFRGGAKLMTIEKGRCSDPRWKVIEVKMINRDEYLEALDVLTQG